MARSKIIAPPPSPLLARVTHAIAHQAATGADPVPGDLLAALRELANIAGLVVPARGIIPTEQVRSAIDQVATRHLERGKADRIFRSAVERINGAKERDAIEMAHARLLDLGELAHYYAGVVVALTLTDLTRK